MTVPDVSAHVFFFLHGSGSLNVSIIPPFPMFKFASSSLKQRNCPQLCSPVCQSSGRGKRNQAPDDLSFPFTLPPPHTKGASASHGQERGVGTSKPHSHVGHSGCNPSVQKVDAERELVLGQPGTVRTYLRTTIAKPHWYIDHWDPSLSSTLGNRFY